MSPADYVGRFAPSPTGPLHAGSLVAALASHLDARVHAGSWLLRIEDLDRAREVAGATDAIVGALARMGFEHDGLIVRQSTRDACYRAAFERLRAAGLVYPCACSRKEIADSLSARGDAPIRYGELVYPGTCRAGLPAGRAPRAWRLRVPDTRIDFNDRWLGPQSQAVASTIGDFVLLRADGFWAYQLAVVVDDAEQGVTDVVRGADLLHSSARQILLQQMLGLPTPRYLHVPVVTDAHGEKLSKQTGAPPIDGTVPLPPLQAAAGFLGLEHAASAGALDAFWPDACSDWGRRFGPDAPGSALAQTAE